MHITRLYVGNVITSFLICTMKIVLALEPEDLIQIRTKTFIRIARIVSLDIQFKT